VQAPSEAEPGVTGFLGWLSCLWRELTDDDSATEAKAAAEAEATSSAVAEQQQDESQRAEGQWTHVVEH
jgi:hypothetical protein